ncbi:MAG: aromatic acid exporter family protein [Clostridium sp.]|uniref:FUSC family protein n=1 Tax=Clostridium sp. TaxID=1506 RepID=UPI002FCC4477
MKIGVRNIKTAIAVFISILLSNAFELPSPFLAGINALMMMEASVVGSLRAGKGQILGTLFGAALGFSFVLIDHGNVYLAAIGVILIISLCNRLKWDPYIATSGIIFISILFGPINSTNALTFTLNSVFGTMIGIVVAIGVNFLVAPPNHTYRIYKSAQILRDRTSEIIKHRLCYKENVDTSGYYRMIQNLESDLKTHLQEISIKKSKPIDLDNINRFIFAYKNIYFHLKALNELDEKFCFTDENLEKIKSIFGIDPTTPMCVDNEECVIFNYHSKKIIDEFIAIQSIVITQSEDKIYTEE